MAQRQRKSTGQVRWNPSTREWRGNAIDGKATFLHLYQAETGSSRSATPKEMVQGPAPRRDVIALSDILAPARRSDSSSTEASHFMDEAITHELRGELGAARDSWNNASRQARQDGCVDLADAYDVMALIVYLRAAVWSGE